jgi:hypothetical protein
LVQSWVGSAETYIRANSGARFKRSIDDIARCARGTDAKVSVIARDVSKETTRERPSTKRPAIGTLEGLDSG